MKHRHKDSLLSKKGSTNNLIKPAKTKPTLGTYLYVPPNGPFPTNRNSYKFTK